MRWAAGGEIPLSVEGRGLVDCNLYQQAGRLILHVVNLTSSGTWRAPIDELIPIGPLDVRVRLPKDVAGKSAEFHVSGGSATVRVERGWVEFRIPTVLDHEMVVIG